jgi:hypothetical protein
MNLTERNMKKAGIAIFTIAILVSAALAFRIFAASGADAPISKRSVSLDNKSFIVDGHRLFVFSGAIHYFRVPEELWNDRLMKMKAAGLNTIETYVAWNFHEPREGQADYSSLDRFLTLAEKWGFYVIVRPGPYICAEWEAGGFPAWAIAKSDKLRTTDPAHLAVVKHYFDGVLPVIREHLYTNGGRVIMFQLENEYDFFHGSSDEVKLEYVRYLYKLAVDGGIDVPMITCWTKVARRRNDPDMRNILDTCNFYPRGKWDNVETDLRMLGLEQPNKLKMVTELEGGWFSEVGATLSREQERVDAPEIRALTRLVIANGVTSFNYYMFHGGTNFANWPSKGKTTSYDYNAPIGETGELYDKYFEVRLIGQFLGTFGPALADGQPSREIVKIEEGDSSAVRVYGIRTPRGAFAFVHNRSDKSQTVKLNVRSTSKSEFRPLCKNSALALEKGEFLILPINVLSESGAFTIVSSTTELILNERDDDFKYIAVYSDAGRDFDITLGLPEKPADIPTIFNASWDKDRKELRISGKIPEKALMIDIGGNLRFLAIERGLASRLNWMAGPVVTDAVSFWDWYGGIPGIDELAPFGFGLFFNPGANYFAYAARGGSASVSIEPKTIRLDPEDGALLGQIIAAADKPVSEENNGGAATSSTEFKITKFRAKPDMLFEGKYDRIPALAPLEKMGYYDPGFYRYMREFKNSSEDCEVEVELYAADPVEVFVDNTGQKLPADTLKTSGMTSAFKGKVAPGDHKLLVLYENPGRTNGGEYLGEPKGIKNVTVSGASPDDVWRIAAGLNGEAAGWQNENFAEAAWYEIAPGLYNYTKSGLKDEKGVNWYRTRFAVEKREGWDTAIKLKMKSDGFAHIYLNGRLIGKYYREGPQTEFYLPAPWLRYGDKYNTLAIAVQGRGGYKSALFEASITEQFLYNRRSFLPFPLELSETKRMGDDDVSFDRSFKEMFDRIRKSTGSFDKLKVYIIKTMIGNTVK